jgi:protein kinase-like protein
MEGRLSPHAESDLHRHVDSCDRCREFLAGLGRAWSAGGADADRPTASAGPSWSAVPPAPPTPAPTHRLAGRYRIERLLGQGGMGVVYRAVDERLGRRVALKVLSPLLADPVARGRFDREARAAGALDHPHIGAIHEIGEHAGEPFLVIAFLDGETLATRIARGPLDVPTTFFATRRIGLRQEIRRRRFDGGAGSG